MGVKSIPGRGRYHRTAGRNQGRRHGSVTLSNATWSMRSLSSSRVVVFVGYAFSAGCGADDAAIDKTTGTIPAEDVTVSDPCAGNPCGMGTCRGLAGGGHACTCPGGHYDDGATCSACAPIERCASGLTCTGPSDSVCGTCADGTYGLGATCSAWTACSAEQYESAAPGATSDRACRALSVCTAEQYELVAPTGTSDRLCVALAICTKDQYEAAAPTPTEDRVCLPFSVCTSGQFESAAPTATSDRSCAPCTPISGCAAVTCTNANDAMCAACQEGTWGNGASCSAWTACGDGEYEFAAPSATSDRQCRTCAPIANCNAATCTSLLDEVCTTCADGFTLSAGACSNFDDCQNVTTCGTGTCLDGLNAYTCDCSPGAFGDGTTLCTACEAIPHCNAVTCTSLLDEVCTTCADGFTLSAGACSNFDDCQNVTACGAGTCIDGLNAYTCDCPPGASGDGTTLCTACEAIPHCNAVTCTSLSDESCTACADGYALSAGACTQIDDCQNVTACGAGTCIDGLDAYTCDCPPGAFGDGTTLCTACEAIPHRNAVTCTSLSDESCTTCADTFVPDGSGGCTPAASGAISGSIVGVPSPMPTAPQVLLFDTAPAETTPPRSSSTPCPRPTRTPGPTPSRTSPT